MDPVNLLILLVTFLAVTVICWGLVVIYCCISQYYPCSSSSSSNSSIEQNLYQMDSYAVISKNKNQTVLPVPSVPQIEYLSPMNLMSYVSPNPMSQSLVPYNHRPSYPSLVYPAGQVCIGPPRAGIRRHTSLRTISYPSYFPHAQAIAIPPPIPPPNPYLTRRSMSRAASAIPTSSRVITVQPIYSCPTANSNLPIKPNITSASVTGAPPLPPMSKHPTIRKSRRLTHPLSDLAYI